MSDTNESKLKIVGTSKTAINRVVDILMGVDAEFRVPMQGLELPVRPGAKDLQSQSHWWREDAELDPETGFCSLEVKGTIVAHGVGFPTICKALDVGVEFYMAERRRWRQEYLAVSHTGEVTSKREDSFGPPEEDGKPQDVVESDLEPDDWGWGHFGSFATDAEIYAGVK